MSIWSVVFATVVSFAVTAVTCRLLIPILEKLKFGQSILEIGPKWHMTKQGTPTMGGISFIAGISVATLAMAAYSIFTGDYKNLILVGFSLVFGVIGFIDDYAKVVKKKNKGLTAVQKLLLQVTAAAVFLSLLRLVGGINHTLYIPFFNIYWQVPWTPYLVIMMFAIVGCVNAVNLTDGIDGLASCVTIPVALTFLGLAIAMKQTVGIYAAALLGALPAFLIFNFNPAKVFMGDTGSLYLGGAVVGLAFALDIPLILIFVGIVYIVETLSDIIQVSYFKLSHGKRVFKMAPIHHHFEMCGWNEKKICAVFTLVCAAGCAIGIIGVLGRIYG